MTYMKAETPSPDHFGLPVHKYELDPMTFANGTVHEPNSCFQNNIPSGLQNNTFCGGENVPIYLSFPHFYQVCIFSLLKSSKTKVLQMPFP